MTIKPLYINEAEFVAYRLAVELMNSKDEPMPAFDTRSPGKLESCLAQPFQTVGGKYMYYSFISRVALLFYLITKNHCFYNGNKRMAVTLTMTFCYKNKRWLNIPPMELYRVAKQVAESSPKNQTVTIDMLKNLFRDKITALK
jgi:death-on-curing protein